MFLGGHWKVPRGGGMGWDGSVSNTCQAHSRADYSYRPCRRLPRAGLRATQTTTDPVRDWRSEISSGFLGVGLPGFGSRSCSAGKGHGSRRHEPALMHYVSREQALDQDLSSGGGGGGRGSWSPANSFATSVRPLRHHRMGQGPTEPHAGRRTFLLSSGGAGGGCY